MVIITWNALERKYYFILFTKKGLIGLLFTGNVINLGTVVK